MDWIDVPPPDLFIWPERNNLLWFFFMLADGDSDKETHGAVSPFDMPIYAALHLVDARKQTLFARFHRASDACQKPSTASI
jgi:hypothetical protein